MEEITESAREKVKGVLSRVDKAELSTGVRSKSLMGLPVRRVIPQDVHSVLDYTGGAAGLVAAFFANTARARLANTMLSTTTLGVSALTDYKLSLAKVVPIEVHEVVDYVWGLGNVMAPFALGYYRKDKAVSLIQIALGIGTVAASLVTDYRSFSRARSNGESRTQSQSRPKRRTKNGGGNKKKK
jgi:hypothetical protein